jgi:rare lipoprotein A
MTAASTLFPLGTVLKVTNLHNGRTVNVTVDDHGPYVKGRALDLSHQAAKRLGMLGPGTTTVRMAVLRSPPGGPPLGQRYCVQVGSFRDIRKARRVQQRIAPVCPDSSVVEAYERGAHFYRVRSGFFTDRSSAEARAGNLERLGYSPTIITE